MKECDTVLSGVWIPGYLSVLKTYKVVEWVTHKYGTDPVVICDNGKTVMFWHGLFHE